MKKISLIVPPQAFQLDEVNLKDINKNIKNKIAQKYKEVFKKKFFWNKNFLLSNFYRYDVNTALFIGIILSKEKDSKYSLFAGISIGEFLSLYFSNILNLDDTIELIIRRTKILFDQNTSNPGFMLSINGSSISEIKKIIRDQNFKLSVKISLIFSDNFFCISITKRVYKKLVKILRIKDINFVILENNGPWHSSLIIKSKEKVKKLINSYNYKFNNKVLSNYTGKKHKSLTNLKKNLINQTFNVVRWDKNLENIQKTCNYYSSPYPIKTIQKIMYLTRCKIDEI